MHQYTEKDFYYPEAEDIENEILTPREVMNYLCVGRSTFYHLVQAGSIPAFKIGKQWRISKAALLKYIDIEQETHILTRYNK